VADVGLDGADRAEAGLARAPNPEGLGQAGDFDGIAQGRARAVRLDVADGLGIDPGGQMGLADDPRLPLDGRRREADLAGAVVVDGRPEDDSVDRVAAGHGVFQALEHDRAHAAAAHRSRRAGVEGAGVAVRRGDPALFIEIAGLLGHAH
jgi:hypothetical protein